MTGLAKFLFEHSFDEHEAPHPASAEAAAQRERRQAELDDAFARGREAGAAEATAADAHRVAEATDRMTEQLAGIEHMRDEIERATTDAAIRFALNALRKMLPSIEQRIAVPEVEAVLTDCLHRVLDEPRIVFRVPDDLLDPMQGRIDDVARRAGFNGKVVLLADGGLGPSDCRVEWADGGAERDLDRIWTEVEALINRALDRPSEAHPASAPSAAANPT